MIKASNITKIYNKDKVNVVNALNGVDIGIEKGSCVAIMGVSGSGKSTILNILGCLDVSTSGEYWLDGINVSQMSSSQIAVIRNDKIGFVLQESALLGKDTVLENVKLPLLFSKKFKIKQYKSRVLEVLGLLNIADLAKRKVNNLSGGQKQRVAIARALVNIPEIIFADEPTSALDSVTAKDIMDIFIKLKEEGKTIVIVTHDITVANYADIIYLMKDGLLEKSSL